jgi:lysyl-tRNA synthetase class 2
MIEAARSLGCDARDDWTWEQAFHGAFLSRVEPGLPCDRPLVLADWPAAVRTTARRKPGTPWAERWELYLDGVEVANCYTEETDPREVDRFMADEALRKRRTARVVPRVDEGYGRLFTEGFPDCSGVALGVDRLEMVFRGERSLEGVINFPLSAIVRG